MNISSGDLARIIDGKLTGPADLPVREVITDSRQAAYSEGQVFYAIRGKNHDGHQFIPSLYDKGIRTFVVDSFRDEYSQLKEAAFVISGNAVSALQKLAAWRRKNFTSPVIAVTGSTGKTIVKEWLADILGQSMPVIRSPKSYNSQIGVPLSVLRLDEKYRLGIFEAGISQPGEMDNLAAIIRPDFGVITNIGDAHSENFTDHSAKASEKLKLFADSSVIVYCRDHRIIDNLIRNDKNLASKKLISWSLEDRNASLFITILTGKNGLTILKVSSGDNTEEFRIPFTDRASIENAITVTTVCYALGTDHQVIRKGLASLVAVAMRMELKSGINNCRIIEDYYNSDPGSLGMAIEFLLSHKGRKPALILSDFMQSGRNERELYSEVAGLVEKSGILRFIGIGRFLSANRDLFSESARFYESTEEFISVLTTADFRNEIILLKGARIFEFEKIAHLIEEQIHQTVLEVDLDAISHNINEFRRCLNPGTKIMAMVKAFAYGAGPAEIAGILEYQRINYLAVAYVGEGVELRNAGVTLPIMVANPDPASVDMMISYSLEPEIFSIKSLERFASAASRHGLVNYPVHVKIDSGMHRLGFMPGEVTGMANVFRNNDSLKIISVFSHLAASDDPEYDELTHKQVSVFLSAAEQIQIIVGYPFLRHILNSAGITRFPQYQFEMVRPGIGMYGVGCYEGITLKTVGRFKSRISQIKLIGGGEPVGYGFSDVSNTDRLIAIVPVGYADGLSRMMGNRRGSLFIKGERAPIIGRVCMDMCMADVTGLDAEEGDEAEIFGDNIGIDEVAGLCGTIPYEILTSVPRRVKRVFSRE
jgi:alanine racemase